MSPTTALMVAVLCCQAPEAPGPYDAAARERIEKSVQNGFSRYPAEKRAEVAEHLHKLWKFLPEDPSIRKQGLQRIAGHVDIATHLFPRDQDYRDLRARHPELPNWPSRTDSISRRMN